MRKTQMSAMLTALAINAPGGLAFVCKELNAVNELNEKLTGK